MAYTWDDLSGRYRDARGRYVSESTVRRVVDAVADAASDRLAMASQALLDGRMSLAAWQVEAQQTIRLAHVATAVLAHGGSSQMSPARWGAIGPEVRAQYQYLRDFAQQIADGRQPLNGGLTARARQYGQASRSTFENTRRRGMQERGYRYERSVLHPAEHCGLCVQEAGKGWQPIGSLIPIGQRTCRQNDHCTLSYARTIEGEAAA